VTVAPVEVIAVLNYASNLLPSLTTDDYGERILTLRGVAVAIAMLALFTVVNIFGVRIYARTNAIVTVWKVIVPLSASILLILVGFRWENLYEFGGFAPTGLSGIFGASRAASAWTGRSRKRWNSGYTTSSRSRPSVVVSDWMRRAQQNAMRIGRAS
jgi:amino acid transporter